jgi:hypothetical protein
MRGVALLRPLSDHIGLTWGLSRALASDRLSSARPGLGAG